jgi:uncharacterized protein YehS (DUF1456 family)
LNRLRQVDDEGFGELPDIDEEDGEDRNLQETETPNEETIVSQAEPDEETMENPEAAARRTAVLSLPLGRAANFARIVDYIYDVDDDKWCQVTLSFSVGRRTMDISNLVRKACEKGVLHQVNYLWHRHRSCTISS